MNGMIIAQNILCPDDLLSVSKAVLRSQDLKEESWDEDRAQYMKTNVECSEEAVKEFGLDSWWIRCIMYWNIEQWNDIQDWANVNIKNLKEIGVE